MVHFVRTAAIIAGIILIGILESALTLPLIAVGCLFFVVRQMDWWLRLSVVLVVGITLGVAQMISPAVAVLILLGGTWAVLWYRWATHQRHQMFFVTLAVVLSFGILRNFQVSFSTLLALAAHTWLFWLITSLFVNRRPRASVFFVPPQARIHDGKNSN